MSIQDIARPSTVHLANADLLRGLCGGAVYLPGDAGYDEARTPWNVAVDQRPAAVAFPANAVETAQLVRAAVAAGLRVAPQSTGHNAGPLGRLDDVVIVRTSGMTHVDIDPARQRARVGGGALWLPVVEAAAAQGFAVLHGSSPDVGVAGYSLGGGIFMYSRKLGMQTNNITGVELVTATGSIVWASATENAELFWAVRGGGGNFGIVTALEFAIFPFQDAYAGMLVWDRTETERVIRAWADWAGTAPDEVTTSFRVLNLPPLPDIPEPFRGRQLVVIDGAVLDTAGVGPSGSMCSRASEATGTRPKVSISGSRARSAARISMLRSSVSSTAPSMTTSWRPRNGSGISGDGGRFSTRNDVVTSSGAVRAHSAQARSTRSVSVRSHTSIPA